MSRSPDWRRSVAVSVSALLIVAACVQREDPGDVPASPDPETNAATDPSGAQWPLVEMLREAAARPPNPADRGGRAWRDTGEGTQRATVRSPGRFVLHFEVGDAGIATGGSVFFQVSPFWGWSTPQNDAPEAPGYTTIEPSRDDIEMRAESVDQQLLVVENTGDPLRAGDRLRLVYGAGPAGAFADKYAEKNSRFWFAVDGDGDGQRGPFLADSPGIDVAPGPAAQIAVTVPTTAQPGERVRITLALLDPFGNARPDFSGDVVFEDPPAGIALPDRVHFETSDSAAKTIEAIVRDPGVYRLQAVTDSGIVGTSNPMLVADAGPRVLWGDLHGHSALSDGTGTVADYFTYARDVAALDVAVLTDHDHWGMLPMDANPALWDEIVRDVKRFHDPGRFVTVLGYEWTSWIHGHRHVLFFSDEGNVMSSLSTAYESPTQLWAALAGKSALTFAHHSAGGPIQTNWAIPPDPAFEPVTEIVSIHGSSEALDSPVPIYSPVPGNFVRDVLDRGYRLGFIGSGDSHDGHPGLAGLQAPTGGLAAILTEDRTREGVLAALRQRRVYATNGPRILLRTAFGHHVMGAVVPVPAAGELSDELFVHVVAQTPLERIDLIRSGNIVETLPIDGSLEIMLQRPVESLRAGEYLYVRAVQQDSGAAWSSPIFFE